MQSVLRRNLPNCLSAGPCCVKKTTAGGMKTDDSVPFMKAQPPKPAGGTITIAPGVEMPIISNGYSPFTANDNTTKALEEWFRVGVANLCIPTT